LLRDRLRLKEYLSTGAKTIDHPFKEEGQTALFKDPVRTAQ